MSKQNAPHPKNVAGDFYVVDQCCTACGVPTHHAPETFAFENDQPGASCYVHRQPTSPEEVDRALMVVRCQEFGCIRYRGTNPVILRRLTEADSGDQCDAPLPAGLRPVLRNHVAVEAKSRDARSWESDIVLKRFCQWLTDQRRHQTTPIIRSGSGASFSFSWTEKNFHPVMASPLGDGPGRWLLQHSGNLAASETIDEWLKGEDELGAVRWYSQEEWTRGLPGQTRPW
ncbi:ferredoxin [Myxococcus sp. AM001]|uniref:ferredoxin n=1 Tax=Myxococcus vastator TaxID=2709664 RepID=UPI0013D4D110|nr:ferredoxin [Myxococcus vastator]NVJ04828.1 ferredoxin [Myxococcus sp. AM001]